MFKSTFSQPVLMSGRDEVNGHISQQLLENVYTFLTNVVGQFIMNYSTASSHKFEHMEIWICDDFKDSTSALHERVIVLCCCTTILIKAHLPQQKIYMTLVFFSCFKLIHLEISQKFLATRSLIVPALQLHWSVLHLQLNSIVSSTGSVKIL